MFFVDPLEFLQNAKSGTTSWQCMATGSEHKENQQSGICLVFLCTNKL